MKQTPTQLYKKHLEFIPTQIGRWARTVWFNAFCQRLKAGWSPKKAIETPRDEKRVTKTTAKDLVKASKKISKAGVKAPEVEKPAETPIEPPKETKEKLFETNIHTENKIFVPRNLSRVDKVWGWVCIIILSEYTASVIAKIYEAIINIK